MRPLVSLAWIGAVAAALTACRTQRDVLPHPAPCTPRPVASEGDAGEPWRLLSEDGLGTAGNCRAVVVADLDGDGDDDLLAGHFEGPVELWRGDGRGGWTRAEVGSLGAPAQTFGLTPGDVDGDGRIDVYTSLSGPANQLHVLGAGGAEDAWARVDGGDATDRPAKSHAAALSDLDRDGDLDLVVANRDSANQLLLNDGRGHFTGRDDDPLVAGAANSRDVVVGDLDGDRAPDVVVVNGADQADELWINAGDGRMTAADSALHDRPGKSAACDLGDVDGDGDLDLVVVCRQGEPGRLWINDGRAGFSERAGALPAGGNSSDCRLADLDGDGHLDLVIAERKAAPTLLAGDGAGGFTAFAGLPDELGAGVDGTACTVSVVAPGATSLLLGNGAGPLRHMRFGR